MKCWLKTLAKRNSWKCECSVVKTVVTVEVEHVYSMFMRLILNTTPFRTTVFFTTYGEGDETL